jgi:hypothetical protein
MAKTSTAPEYTETAALTNRQNSRGGSGEAAKLLLADRRSHAAPTAVNTRESRKAGVNPPFTSVALVATSGYVAASRSRRAAGVLLAAPSGAGDE